MTQQQKPPTSSHSLIKQCKAVSVCLKEQRAIAVPEAQPDDEKDYHSAAGALKRYNKLMSLRWSLNYGG